jgi:hypothetical protein
MVESRFEFYKLASILTPACLIQACKKLFKLCNKHYVKVLKKSLNACVRIRTYFSAAQKRLLAVNKQSAVRSLL